MSEKHELLERVWNRELSADDAYKEIVDKYDEAADSVLALYAEISRLKGDIEEANSIIIAHANTISRIETANAHLQNRLTEARLSQDPDEWDRHVADLNEDNRALRAENERLKSAVIKTLNSNGHLADGENCTLIDLKRAVPAWELEG